MWLSLLFIVASVSSIRISEKENEILQSKCGTRFSRKRILWGDNAFVNERTYAVGIVIYVNGQESRCSGSLISNRHVLTAAHCFNKPSLCKKWTLEQEPEESFVHSNISIFFNKNNHRPIKAAQVYVNGEYAASRCASADIAIIELEKDVQPISDEMPVQFACLAGPKTKVLKHLSIAGYGYDPHDIALSRQLKIAHFEFMKDCSTVQAATWDTLCIHEKDQFICMGDSGGGLVQRGTERWIIVATVVIGLKCDNVVAKMRAHKDNGTELNWRGSGNTDVRKHVKWICFVTGVCHKSVRVNWPFQVEEPLTLQ